MTDTTKATPETITKGKKLHGVVAEFTDVDSLLAACRRVRDAGYTKADAFTPFPVHGIDTALGIKPTVLPWIALAAGLSGTTIALLMQISMNGSLEIFEGFSYPYIISGKPFVSLPAFIPVTFELTILLASFGTFFGMWALNGLPKFSNPMFTSPRFDRVTDDTFFLFLDAKDSRFDEAGAKSLLADLGGEYIEPVLEDDTPKTIPKVLLVGLATMIALSMIPALVVLRMRVTKSDVPRFHIFPDMDFSPAKDAQQVTTLFADGRSSRADVPGTVSRGSLDWDLDFQTGIDMEKLSQIDAPRAERLVAMMQSDKPTGSEEAAKATETVEKAKVSADEKPKAKSEETKSDKMKAEEAKPEAKAKEPEAKADDSKPAEPKPVEAKAETTESKPDMKAEEEPAPEKTTAEKPIADKPDADKPDADKPKKETPKADTTKKEPKPESKKPAAMEPESLQPATGTVDASVDKTPWLQKNPVELTAAVFERGQQQFNIYCSVCHGMNGLGNGLVNQRAQKIMATTWTPPSNMHDATLYKDAYPDGKLFGTISNGVRKMPGYAGQIKAKDRWAIVAYVRALQASRNGSLDDVPAGELDKLKKRQEEVKAKLKELAEAEAAKAAEAEKS